ncbi:hypothetical protein F5Y18DRAFT_424729 [Xylariaceae sp. FL1019]|nr:hypothetical protein F5Y18DRAFT_424729 [Xylariaceae sp. FL1019]
MAYTANFIDGRFDEMSAETFGDPIKPEVYNLTDSKPFIREQVRRYLGKERLILLKVISVADSAALLSLLRDLKSEVYPSF